MSATVLCWTPGSARPLGIWASFPLLSSLGAELLHPEPDVRKGSGDGVVVLALYDDHLRFVARVQRDDDEGRRPIALDIELDTSDGVDANIEHEPIVGADDQSLLGHDDRVPVRGGAGADLVRFERSQTIFHSLRKVTVCGTFAACSASTRRCWCPTDGDGVGSRGRPAAIPNPSGVGAGALVLG